MKFSVLRSGKFDDQNRGLFNFIQTVYRPIIDMPMITELMLQHNIIPTGGRALSLDAKEHWQQKAEQYGWSEEKIENLLLTLQSLFPDYENNTDIINEVLDDCLEEEMDELDSLIGNDSALRNLTLAGLYGLHDLMVPGFERP